MAQVAPAPTSQPLLQAPGVAIASFDDLTKLNGVTVSQKTSECCRCCCCQPNIDWDVTNYPKELKVGEYGQLPPMINITEDASYVGRCFAHAYPGCRKTEYTLKQAGTDNVLGYFNKNATCPANFLLIQGKDGPVYCPCCCCLPNLRAYDADKNQIGETQYVCDGCLFVPKFHVLDADKKKKYLIRPDTCIAGCCVQFRCDGIGAKCCRVPFYLRDPENPDQKLKTASNEDAQITDLWAGGFNEFCTQKNWYGVQFPHDADANMRATLLASTLLIDIVCFEQDQ